MRTRGSLRELLERGDGGEQHPQPDVDEVDVGDRQRDVACEDDTCAEHAVDELHERHLLLEPRPFRDAHRDSSGATKLCAGQGPVTRYDRPWRRWRASRDAPS